MKNTKQIVKEAETFINSLFDNNGLTWSERLDAMHEIRENVNIVSYSKMKS